MPYKHHLTAKQSNWVLRYDQLTVPTFSPCMRKAFNSDAFHFKFVYCLLMSSKMSKLNPSGFGIDIGVSEIPWVLTMTLKLFGDEVFINSPGNAVFVGPPLKFQVMF